MPIKFRCAYCNQLMGIGRRKAGSVVSCPNCNGQVVVPDPGPAKPDFPVPAPSPLPNVFEGNNFDPGLLQPRPLQTPPTPPTPLHKKAPPTADMGDFDVQPMLFPMSGGEPTALPDTPVPPPTTRWLFVAIAVVLVFIAFAAGFAVARLM